MQIQKKPWQSCSCYLICYLVSVIVMLQIGLRLLSPFTMGVGEGGVGYLEVR